MDVVPSIHAPGGLLQAFRSHRKLEEAQIRQVQIESGAGVDHIICKLVHKSIDDDDIKYDALSYV